MHVRVWIGKCCWVCREIDIFDSQTHFPDWIYDFREQNCTKSVESSVWCQVIKDEGLFQSKVPHIEELMANGVPIYQETHLVVLLLNDRTLLVCITIRNFLSGQMRHIVLFIQILSTHERSYHRFVDWKLVCINISKTAKVYNEGGSIFIDTFCKRTFHVKLNIAEY